MWKNYLKIAFRNLQRNRGYAAINLGGLAVGLATFLVIALYVQHELSYDNHHEHGDRIYRVLTNMRLGDEVRRLPSTSGLLAPSLESSFPEVEEAVRIFPRSADSLFHRGDVFEDVTSYYAEPDIFSLFSFQLFSGDPTTALSAPNSVVLTKTLAEKIFGSKPPLGQTLEIARRSYEGQVQPRVLEVTGVMADVPETSHFSFDALISLETLKSTRLATGWGAFQYWTYVMLSPGKEAGDLESKLPAFAKSKHGEERTSQTSLRYELEPLSEVYFSSAPAPRQGDIRYVWTFSAIALLVLLIVCGNYVNLAVARSASRTQEVAVRKVMGARRWQLIRQFLSESLVLALLALPLGLLLLRASTPIFSRLAGVHLESAPPEGSWFLFVAVGVVGLVGLVAGSYPALFLSRFEPADVLRDRLRSNLSSGRLRRLLIVLQFAVSVALIFGTATVFRQLSYMQNTDLGFNEEQLVTIPIKKEMSGQAQALKRELQNQPSVLVATATNGVPAGRSFGRGSWSEVLGSSRRIDMRGVAVDYDYFDALEVEFAAGRSFSEERSSDKANSVILNETAVKRMGWTSAQDAIGKRLRGSQVIGVVRDFHYRSLHDPIEPLSFVVRPGHYSALLVRVRGDDLTNALANIRSTWDRFAPDVPFDFSFLDEQIEQLYEKEQNAGKLMSVFTTIAVLLACLGLLGLASYSAARRTKEIGIRKVFGASAGSIVVLLSKDFAKLVIAANVVALPLAYLVVSRWLEDFAYHVAPSIWLFVGTGIVSLAIAMASVGTQTAKAALSNPVDTLRYE